jgi:hypothetical protein
MKSLLLMSVFLAQLIIPALAARDSDPRRGVRRMAWQFLLFNALYIAYLTLVHPVLFVPSWP